MMFKVGDKVRHKNGKTLAIIKSVYDSDSDNPTYNLIYESGSSGGHYEKDLDLSESFNPVMGAVVMIVDANPGCNGGLHSSGVPKTGHHKPGLTTIITGVYGFDRFTVSAGGWMFSKELLYNGRPLYTSHELIKTGEKKVKAPETELEKTACNEAVDDAIKAFVAAKKAEYTAAMKEYIALKPSYDKFLQLEKDLKITEEIKKQIF